MVGASGFRGSHIIHVRDGSWATRRNDWTRTAVVSDRAYPPRRGQTWRYSTVTSHVVTRSCLEGLV